MCVGKSPKISVPEPPKLPPPPPAPEPPKPPKPAAKPLQQPGQVPDIRIGAAKRQPTTSARRTTGTTAPGKQSLSIGSNQGLNI